MAWVRLDDQFSDHPKVMAAGPAAAWLFVCGLTYCSRLLTDGFIPASQVRKLADLKGTDGLAGRLIEVGLWDRAEGGFRVHDYLDYQPSADKVRGERRAAQERMQRFRSDDVRSMFGRTNGEREESSESIDAGLRDKVKTNQRETESKIGIGQAFGSASPSAESENVRPNIERSSHSPTPPRPFVVVSSETTTPPNPPNPNGASSASGYVTALNGGFSEISADFTKLDPELTATWLRKSLTRAESRAGPLAPEQIVGGLELAILRIERAVTAPSSEHPIRNVRGFAAGVLTEALEEQAHADANGR